MKLPLLILFLAICTARAEDFATQMLEATFKLFNKDSTATGFLVRAPKVEGESPGSIFVVTANHVFEKMSGDRALLVLRVPGANGTWTRRDFPLPTRREGQPLWFKHGKEDVAVLQVELPAEVPVRVLPFEALATEHDLEQVSFHLASPLCLLGFPTRFEANAAGFPVARNAMVASYPLLPVKVNHTYLADFTTFAGDSGGPVFVPDTRNKPAAGEDVPPLVVGLVLAQMRHDEQTHTLTSDTTVHVPLDLGIILQAQYIREAIELAPKGPSVAPVPPAPPESAAK